MRHVRANHQPDLDDAVDRTLERLSSVPRSDVAGFSAEHLGRHQQFTGLCASCLCVCV